MKRKKVSYGGGMDGNCRGGVEERTGWEEEDKRTKWSERGKEEGRGGQISCFFFCVYYSF